MRANNDNCPEALLAVMDAAAAERYTPCVPGHSGRTTIPAFLICSCAAYLYSFPELQFVSLPRFQQLPDLGLPRFQLGNVGIVEMSGAVDAAADMVDVGGNPADSGS